MTERRAVNFFDPLKPVSDDQLKRIVETAALAAKDAGLASHPMDGFDNDTYKLMASKWRKSYEDIVFKTY